MRRVKLSQSIKMFTWSFFIFTKMILFVKMFSKGGLKLIIVLNNTVRSKWLEINYMLLPWQCINLKFIILVCLLIVLKVSTNKLDTIFYTSFLFTLAKLITSACAWAHFALLSTKSEKRSYGTNSEEIMKRYSSKYMFSFIPTLAVSF